jgi:hypothetical protein
VNLSDLLLRLLGLSDDAQVARLAAGRWSLGEGVPVPLLLVVGAVGAILALVNFLPGIPMRWTLRLGTFVLRAAMVALLLVALGGVELQARLEVNERRHWVVLLDDSASMATRDAGGKSRFEAALADLERIREAGHGKVDLRVETLSGKAPGAAPGRGPTRFEEAISRAALSRDRVDELVVLTDGRDSDGRDLTRVGENLKARGVRLAVQLYGGAVPPAFLELSAQPERTVLRLGEELVVRGSVSGKVGAAGSMLTLKENGKAIKAIPVSTSGAGRFELRHRPAKKGQFVYELALPPSEAVPEIHAVRFVVTILDEKINVLLVEGFPNFEFKLMRSTLEVDPLVNLVSVCHIPGGGVYVQGQPLHRNPEQGLIASQAELFKYDVVVLRDLPRSAFRAGGDVSETLLQNIVEFVVKRGGGLIVTGGKDVYRAGGYQNSSLASILPFDLGAEISGQDQFDGLFSAGVARGALAHPILQLLPDPVENQARLSGLRQLDGSNNVGQFRPLATPLLIRSVKVKTKGDREVEKEAPIMGVMDAGAGKVLGIAVDTLWRWQLQAEFDDPPLAQLLANAVRTLAPPPGQRAGLPSVLLRNDTPQVGQELQLATDLRDGSFEPIRNAELLVSVLRPDGTSSRMYPRDLPEEPGHYEYRVLLDLPGPYRVTARYGKLEAVRECMAGAATGEFSDLSVDRAGMERLVNAAAGRLGSSGEEGPARTLDARPVRKPAVRDLQVWNSPAVVLLFLLCLSADCFLRKRQGLA